MHNPKCHIRDLGGVEDTVGGFQIKIVMKSSLKNHELKALKDREFRVKQNHSHYFSCKDCYQPAFYSEITISMNLLMKTTMNVRIAICIQVVTCSPSLLFQ